MYAYLSPLSMLMKVWGTPWRQQLPNTPVVSSLAVLFFDLRQQQLPNTPVVSSLAVLFFDLRLSPARKLLHSTLSPTYNPSVFPSVINRVFLWVHVWTLQMPPRYSPYFHSISSWLGHFLYFQEFYLSKSFFPILISLGPTFCSIIKNKYECSNKTKSSPFKTKSSPFGKLLANFVYVTKNCFC